MQKPAEEMTLRDLMDRLDELKFERLRKEELRKKARRAAGHVLSLDDLSEYFGVGEGEIKIHAGGQNPPTLYFRKLDLQA